MSLGPRARFNEFISQVVTSQYVDGSEILVIIDMLRERTLREDFFECLHNHAPCFRLSQCSYYCLLHIMQELLCEADNTGDFTTIAFIFSISSLYGMTVGIVAFNILKSLSNDKAWSNVAFWVHCTDDIVSKDILRWNKLPPKSKKIFTMPDCQVRCTVTVSIFLLVS